MDFFAVIYFSVGLLGFFLLGYRKGCVDVIKTPFTDTEILELQRLTQRMGEEIKQLKDRK